MRSVLITLALLAGIPTASAQEVLSAHNAYRARHCTAPLAWSEQLAAAAARVAQSCVFKHSGNGYGENLFMGTTGFYGAADVVGAWYGEEPKYNYRRGRFSGATGHFTQVIWADTRALGCAMAVCSGQDLWVCNYSPNGNVRGNFRQNVKRPC